MIILVWVLNFVISIFNAWSVGREWAETRTVGGFPRLLSWCGAIMSAAGFTWCYLVPIAYLAGPGCFGKLPTPYVEALWSLGYLTIIGPVIGSGLAITVQSWMIALRTRSFRDGAIAGYNTFAQLYNIGSAIEYVPSAWDKVTDVLFSKDSKNDSDGGNALGRLVILLVVLALLAGCLTTTIILRSTSQSAVSARRLRYQTS